MINLFTFIQEIFAYSDKKEISPSFYFFLSI